MSRKVKSAQTTGPARQTTVTFAGGTQLVSVAAESNYVQLAAKPVRVRETLPIVREGNMIGLFVWFEQPNP